MNSLVGQKAPDFTVPAVLGNGEIDNNFNLYTESRGKMVVLLFYPRDFTFVCPTELISLDNRMDAFRERDVIVVAISTDSHFSHAIYRNMAINQGGIGPVKYIMASDSTHSICQAYGVKHPTDGVAYRAAFIIDKSGIVRSQTVNDLPIGRNIDELLRLADAWQFYEKSGEVCPAGWQKGHAGMEASNQGVKEYLIDNSERL